jgi:hypothetical protein
MRFYHVLIAGFVCCFLACQKEPEDILTPPDCKLETIYYYDAGTVTDTATITYTGDNVSKVDYGSYYVVPEFTNGLLSKRTYYLSGTTTAAAYDEYVYNADSSFNRVSSWFYINGSPVKGYEYDFAWTSGKLTTMTFKQDTSGTGVVPIITYDYTYTGNNITSMVLTDLEFQDDDTLYYTFDNLANHYKKNNTIWVADLLFTDLNGIALPFALSANNVVGFGEDVPNDVTVVTYDLTNRNELASMRFDGDKFSEYRYKCQ